MEDEESLINLINKEDINFNSNEFKLFKSEYRIRPSVDYEIDLSSMIVKFLNARAAKMFKEFRETINQEG